MDIWKKMYEYAKKEYHPQEVTPFIYTHHVVCALEAEDGQLFTGFCFESCCGVLDLCAERVAALNMYADSGQTVIKRIITFRDDVPNGISGMPCGACRELLLQLSPKNADTEILVDYQKREIVRLKAFAGDFEMHGKGIKLVLDDSKIASKPGENPNLYIIHDDDLLRVINELRAAGAEAIAINGERIVAMSEIRCAGPTLSVNNNRSAPPYEIKAIGNPNNLESALKLRGGVLENFKFWGIQADLSQSDDIVIPAFKGRKSFEYAKIAEGQASDAEKEAAEK